MASPNIDLPISLYILSAIVSHHSTFLNVFVDVATNKSRRPFEGECLLTKVLRIQEHYRDLRFVERAHLLVERTLEALVLGVSAPGWLRKRQRSSRKLVNAA